MGLENIGQASAAYTAYTSEARGGDKGPQPRPGSKPVDGQTASSTSAPTGAINARGTTSNPFVTDPSTKPAA